MNINGMNNERRVFARLKRSLPITLLSHGHAVKLRNISPEGVHFEVTTKDIENYSQGKVIMFEVEFGLSKGTDRYVGSGEVVRAYGIDIKNHDKKLGVALKFSGKLKVCV